MYNDQKPTPAHSHSPGADAADDYDPRRAHWRQVHAAVAAVAARALCARASVMIRRPTTPELEQ
jgi:anti-sigma-K factor RskA